MSHSHKSRPNNMQSIAHDPLSGRMDVPLIQIACLPANPLKFSSKCEAYCACAEAMTSLMTTIGKSRGGATTDSEQVSLP